MKTFAIPVEENSYFNLQSMIFIGGTEDLTEQFREKLISVATKPASPFTAREKEIMRFYIKRSNKDVGTYMEWGLNDFLFTHSEDYDRSIYCGLKQIHTWLKTMALASKKYASEWKEYLVLYPEATCVDIQDVHEIISTSIKYIVRPYNGEWCVEAINGTYMTGSKEDCIRCAKTLVYQNTNNDC